jgi:glucoamylase
VIDGGFLELVRMGVKSADDPDILDTIAVYDTHLKQQISGKGPAWFRYNFDGYGETNFGGNYSVNNFGKTRGRLWPIFTAERGMYEIAKAGNVGLAGVSYLNSLRAFSSPEGMVPEQVWNMSASLPGGWWTALPPGKTPGEPTRSMAPLSWAMGEYINLLASIAENRIIDLPVSTCQRYATCRIPLKAGQSRIRLKAVASSAPDQHVYVVGSVYELGRWDPDFALPLDRRGYPVWAHDLNLPASTAVDYRYFRRNADGSILWELLPGGGQRRFSTPAEGGTLILNDSVAW